MIHRSVTGKKGAAQQRTPAAARAQNVPTWEAEQVIQQLLQSAPSSLSIWERPMRLLTFRDIVEVVAALMQDAKRKEVEDAAVQRALDSGRFVDVAVHSFIPEIPPSRLALPEDATINFLRRQIQYRMEVQIWHFLAPESCNAQHTISHHWSRVLRGKKVDMPSCNSVG